MRIQWKTTFININLIVILAILNSFSLPICLAGQEVASHGAESALIIHTKPEPALNLPLYCKGPYAAYGENSFIFYNGQALIGKTRNDDEWTEHVIATVNLHGLCLGDLLPEYPGEEIVTADSSEFYPTVWAYIPQKQIWQPLIRGKYAWDRTQRMIVGKFRDKQRNSLVVQSQNGALHLLDVENNELNLIWKSPKPFPAIELWQAADLDGDGRDEIVGAYYNKGIFILKEVSGALKSVWENYPWGKVLDLAVRGQEVYFNTAQKVFGVITHEHKQYKMKAFTSQASQPYRWLIPTLENRILGLTGNGSAYEITVGKTLKENAILPPGGQIFRLIPLANDRFIVLKRNGPFELWSVCSQREIRLFINGKEAFPDTEAKGVAGNFVLWQAGRLYFHPELFAKAFRFTYYYNNNGTELTITTRKGDNIVYNLESAHADNQRDCVIANNNCLFLSDTLWKKIVPFKLEVIAENNELQLWFKY